jgi:cysteine desulfurase
MSPFVNYADASASAGFVWPQAQKRWLSLAALGGNASSAHFEGRRARQTLREAREQVAAVLGAHPDEIVFTSGATESLCLAVNGLLRSGEQLALPAGMHAALSAMPHVALAEAALSAVVGVAAACHDTGILTDVAAFAERVAPRRLVVDAAQAALSARELWKIEGVSALAFSGHKIGAPAGTGVLLLRKGAPFVPRLRGGPQEHELRAGTEPVALIGALAAALTEAYRERETIWARQRVAAAVFEKAILQIAGARVFGGEVERSPGVSCVGVIGVPGRRVVEEAGARGVCFSSGAACAAQSGEPSAALLALGVSGERAREAFRASFGFFSSPEDAAQAAAVVRAIVDSARGEKVAA